MCYIFRKINRSFVMCSLLVFTVVNAKIKREDDCNFQNLIDCTKALSVLTNSGLTFFNSKSDLDLICPNLKEAIKCVHGFTRQCMTNEDRYHFKKLFYGTGAMIHDLCRNGRYQEEYLKHAPCMTNMTTENQICFDTYTTAMQQLKSEFIEIETLQTDLVSSEKRKREIPNNGIKNICCAFQQYVQCSTSAVKLKCGDDTAKFSMHFLRKMSSSILNVHCIEFEKIGCGSIKWQTSSSPFKTLSNLPIILLLGIIVIIC